MKPVGYDVEKFKRRYTTIRDRSAELGYTFVKSWQRASWYGDFSKADLAELIECSQMGYEHNIGCVLEQWRAQFPYTGGETLWTYNSLGPIANSWHLIDWCGQPQIPFYANLRANEPVHVMADAGFFSWGPGDTFRASVFALNDAPQISKEAESGAVSTTSNCMSCKKRSGRAISPQTDTRVKAARCVGRFQQTSGKDTCSLNSRLPMRTVRGYRGEPIGSESCRCSRIRSAKTLAGGTRSGAADADRPLVETPNCSTGDIVAKLGRSRRSISERNCCEFND